MKLFGTDGIRGKAGDAPLDEETVTRVGAALVRGRESAGHTMRVLVGRDTRESGDWIERALARGLCGEGAEVTSAGVLPTPAVAYLTRTRAFRRRHRDFGVAQSVRGQRHQGVCVERREAERAGRASSRIHRRRPVLDGGRAGDGVVRARRHVARLPRSRAPDPGRSGSVGRLAHRARLRERRDGAHRPGLLPVARLPRGRDWRRARRAEHQPELRIDASPATAAARGRDRRANGRGVRRRRRSRLVRRSSRPRRGRRRRAADGRGPAEAGRPPAGRRDRRHGDEQYRPGNRPPRARHRASPAARWATST